MKVGVRLGVRSARRLTTCATRPRVAMVTIKKEEEKGSHASERCLVWFRKGLRVHDNPALLDAREAAVRANAPLIAVFVLDPWFFRSGRVGGRRLRFLLQALQDLDSQLRRSLGVPLRVLRGAR